MEYDNIEIKDNVAYISLDSSIYSLKVIYSTSYVFLDMAYLQLNKKDDNVIVRLKLKDKNKRLEDVCNQFLNELLLYADYDKNQEESLKIRERILQRSLLTNDPDSFDSGEDELLDKEFEEFLKELDEEESEKEESDEENQGKKESNSNQKETVQPWEQ